MLSSHELSADTEVCTDMVLPPQTRPSFTLPTGLKSCCTEHTAYPTACPGESYKCIKSKGSQASIFPLDFLSYLKGPKLKLGKSFGREQKSNNLACSHLEMRWQGPRLDGPLSIMWKRIPGAQKGKSPGPGPSEEDPGLTLTLTRHAAGRVLNPYQPNGIEHQTDPAWAGVLQS